MEETCYNSLILACMQTLTGKGAKILLATEETCRKRYNGLILACMQTLMGKGTKKFV